MKVAYVAGPYRADTTWQVHHNIEKAKELALKLWKEGYAVICPHANTAHFDGELPDKDWLDGDLELLSRCDVIALVEGWQNSQGAKAELALALDLGLTVREG